MPTEMTELTNEVVTTFRADLTIIISMVLATCSIIAPMLTALINNRHLRKMRVFELQSERYHEEYLHRRDVYAEYFRAAGRCVSEETLFLDTYEPCYLDALSLSPYMIRKCMIEIDDLIQTEQWPSARRKLYELAAVVNKWQAAELQRYK